MNILFLFNVPILPFNGGIQRVTENLAKEFISRGYGVYCLSSTSTDVNVEYDYPAQQFFLNESLSRDDYIDGYLSILKEKKIDIVVSQVIRDDLMELLAHTPDSIRKITCIHIQPFYTQGDTRNIIKYYKRKGFKAKLFKFYCSLFPSYFRKKSYLEEKRAIERAMTVSDRLCLLSEKFIPRLIRFMPDIDARKLIAVNNPNTFNGDHPIHLKKEKVWICVGRQTNAQKKIPLFIDIWVRFQSLHKDWKAYIIGGDVDLEYNKRYAAKRHTTNLYFTGNIQDVESYYDKASFLVMTSSYEGWGMVLTEAMSHGCIPCAFDTYESLHDIVDDGENGVIAQPYKKEELINKIERLMADASLYEKTQLAAIQKSKQFVVEKIADQWERILKEQLA